MNALEQISVLEQSREDLAAAIRARMQLDFGELVTVYGATPDVLVLPCVTVHPGLSWIGHRTVELGVTVSLSPASGDHSRAKNVEALRTLETILLSVRAAITEHRGAVEPTPAPQSDHETGIVSATTPVTLRYNLC